MAEVTEPIQRTAEIPRPPLGSAATPARRDIKTTGASLKAEQSPVAPT
jgi:hypothetical protein